jgi:hypothetical protein
MLINNRKDDFEVGNVVVLKLISGEEVIAKIDAVQDDVLMLYRPCALGMTQNGPSLNKWVVFADKDLPVPLKQSVLLTHATPDAEVRSHYETVTSNIVKASADILKA